MANSPDVQEGDMENERDVFSREEFGRSTANSEAVRRSDVSSAQVENCRLVATDAVPVLVEIPKFSFNAFQEKERRFWREHAQKFFAVTPVPYRMLQWSRWL
jgi:hypothetical protein